MRVTKKRVTLTCLTRDMRLREQASQDRAAKKHEAAAPRRKSWSRFNNNQECMATSSLCIL